MRCGDDFCVALMVNGLVFAWGDGEEGRLGLGRQEAYVKPTMVDALLPTAYAEVARSAVNADGGGRRARLRCLHHKELRRRERRTGAHAPGHSPVESPCYDPVSTRKAHMSDSIASRIQGSH